MTVRNGASGLYDEVYTVNNVLDGEPLYVGKVTSSGKWLIQRYTAATTEMAYANVSNNTAISGYGSAWTNKATLTYGPFESLTGV